MLKIEWWGRPHLEADVLCHGVCLGYRPHLTYGQHIVKVKAGRQAGRELAPGPERHGYGPTRMRLAEHGGHE